MTLTNSDIRTILLTFFAYISEADNGQYEICAWSHYNERGIPDFGDDTGEWLPITNTDDRLQTDNAYTDLIEGFIANHGVPGPEQDPDPDRQITTEELIAAYLFGRHQDYFSEEQAAQAGRDILQIVLRGPKPVSSRTRQMLTDPQHDPYNWATEARDARRRFLNWAGQVPIQPPEPRPRYLLVMHDGVNQVTQVLDSEAEVIGRIALGFGPVFGRHQWAQINVGHYPPRTDPPAGDTAQHYVLTLADGANSEGWKDLTFAELIAHLMQNFQRFYQPHHEVTVQIFPYPPEEDDQANPP